MSEDTQTRRLAIAVLGTVGLFPAIVLVLNLVQRGDGYSASRDAVSDLALGRGGALMAVAFCSLGLGTLLFAALLHRTSSRSAVRTALVSVAGALSFVSAGFHTDATGAPATTHGAIHDAAGIATFLAMLMAMAVSSWRFRRDTAWCALALPTAGLTAVGVTALFLVPALGHAHFGIAQRLLIGAFLAWIVMAATYRGRVAARRTPVRATTAPAAASR